jgi:hypothetical protein
VHLETFELLSFVLFGAMSLGALVLQTHFVYLYLSLFILDFLGTLFDLGAMLSIDRSAFAAFFVLLGTFAEHYTTFESVLSVIVIIVLLDWSFLLRKIQDTHILGTSFLVKRLRAYVATAGSTILMSYFFVFVYSEISFFALPFAILIFGVAMVSAFVIFILIIRAFTNSASKGFS